MPSYLIIKELRFKNNKFKTYTFLCSWTEFINKYAFNLIQIRDDLLASRKANYYLYIKQICKLDYDLLNLIRISINDDLNFSKVFLENYFNSNAFKIKINTIN